MGGGSAQEQAQVIGPDDEGEQGFPPDQVGKGNGKQPADAPDRAAGGSLAVVDLFGFLGLDFFRHVILLFVLFNSTRVVPTGCGEERD